MTNELLRIADIWERSMPVGQTHWEGCEGGHAMCMVVKLAARVRELEAERDAVQHLSAQHERHRDELLAENDALRALLRDIRAEGRITGNIAERLIAALKESP